MEEKSSTELTYFAVLEKIIATRIELGITQMSIADHLKLSESGYYKVEKGVSKLDLIKLFNILKLLKIRPEIFFKGIK